ncbi:MAG: sterol desaturase family protein [Planctomycetota bacterium]|jgi:sterol desaturase/sphingolipid hydroxylase (fatty acid hydroxylase superfamily)
MKNYAGIVFLSVFTALLLVEQLFPLRQRKHPFIRRFLINMIMTVLVLLTGSFVVRNAALRSSQWALSHDFGLISLMSLPRQWCELLVGILLMDLTFYYWHRANHVIPCLWRFHNAHHIDPDLDVSTSFRFHFIEILYSTLFRLLQVGVLGIAPFTYLTYETLFVCSTMFHHSNVRLPVKLERWLNKIIVTPRMHGIHHSAVKDETNSNYSVIFRWWDRLHGTLVLNVRQSAIKIGVPGYRQKEDNRFSSLLRMPFEKQKAYWNLTDGSLPQSNQDKDSKVTKMLE